MTTPQFDGYKPNRTDRASWAIKPQAKKRHTSWKKLDAEHRALKSQYALLSELYAKMNDELVQLRGQSI